MPTMTWSQVYPGDVIQSKGDEPVAYRVVSRLTQGPNAGGVLIERNGKQRVLPPDKCKPDAKVMVLLSMQAAMDQSVALTQVMLGGKVQAFQTDERDAYRVPVDFVHAGELRAHVWLLHGAPLVADDDDFPALVKQHADLHHPNQKDPRYLAHIHDPQFIKHLEAMRAGEGLR